MTWFKTTDTLMTDAKVMMMPLNERGMALGTWISCGTWSTQHLTDGKVPAPIVEAFVGTLDGAETLVTAHMWKRIRGGYQFNKWDKYQFSREQVETKRDEDRARKAEWRARKDAKSQAKRGNVPDMSQWDTDGTSAESALSRPDPSRPVPTHSKKDISSAVATATADTEIEAPRHDVEELLDYLNAGIASNGSKTPKRNKGNETAMRLLIDKDGRTPDQIRAAIDFATNDEFWRSNILSASKLRTQYDQLRLKAQQQKWKRPTDRHERESQFWENEMANTIASDERRNGPTNTTLEIEAS